MNARLMAAVEATIEDTTGVSAKITGSREVGGGCINRASHIQLLDEREFFLKVNDASLLEMFSCEASGLKKLKEIGPVRVPQVIGNPQVCDGSSFLVLEWIATGHSTTMTEQLGRQLAVMHQIDVGSSYGFEHDNYLGSSHQPNPCNENWVQFFRDHRLGFQLKLARTNGYQGELQTIGDKMLSRLEQLLPTICRPSLIHGDLWSGNYMADKQGKPVLIDPATSFADREAEFGMIVLFGGLDRRFYDAYQEVWPFEDGYSERFEIYKLYHLLNHLNLFGTSYLSPCISTMKKFV